MLLYDVCVCVCVTLYLSHSYDYFLADNGGPRPRLITRDYLLLLLSSRRARGPRDRSALWRTVLPDSQRSFRTARRRIVYIIILLSYSHNDFFFFNYCSILSVVTPLTLVPDHRILETRSLIFFILKLLSSTNCSQAARRRKTFNSIL